MNFTGKRVTLYGRFLMGSRADAVRQLERLQCLTDRDLTRRSECLVIGLGARGLVPSGHLLKKLRQAAELSVPVVSEAWFWAVLAGESTTAPTYPVRNINPPPIDGLLELLNAFDLIAFDGQHCRFGDVAILQSAREMHDQGHEISSIIRLSLKARNVAPHGRHKIVPKDEKSALLQWDDGETELDGQGFLQLSQYPTLDDVFERALLSEAEGDTERAIRDYELCSQMDRTDPVAPFNLGNVFVAVDRALEARDRFSQAIGRDPNFAEAYYNRAQVEDKLGDVAAAVADLKKALEIDPDFSDAMFNLAQNLASLGQKADAALWFDRFIAGCADPRTAKLAQKAKRATLG